MNTTLDKLFNWKKNPASVFFFVVPLVILKFGFLLLFAGLQIYHNNDWVYLIITGTGLVVFCVAMIPMYKIIKNLPNPAKDIANKE